MYKMDMMIPLTQKKIIFSFLNCQNFTKNSFLTGILKTRAGTEIIIQILNFKSKFARPFKNTVELAIVNAALQS
jgi:hypothetical protein